MLKQDPLNCFYDFLKSDLLRFAEINNHVLCKSKLDWCKLLKYVESKSVDY